MDRCCCCGPGTVLCGLVRGPAGLLMPSRGTQAGEAPRPRVSPRAPPRGSCGFPHGSGHGSHRTCRAGHVAVSGQGLVGGHQRAGPRLQRRRPCCQQRRTRGGRGLEERGPSHGGRWARGFFSSGSLPAAAFSFPASTPTAPCEVLGLMGVCQWAGASRGLLVHGVFVPRDQQDVMRPQL